MTFVWTWPNLKGQGHPKGLPSGAPKCTKMRKVLKKSAAKSGLEMKPEKRKSKVWESCSRLHGSSISKVPRHSKKHAKSSPNGTRNNTKVNTIPKLREWEKHVKKKGRQVGEYAEKKRLQAKWDPSETQVRPKVRPKSAKSETQKAPRHLTMHLHSKVCTWKFALNSLYSKVCTQKLVLKSLYSKVRTHNVILQSSYSKACAQKFVLRSLY